MPKQQLVGQNEKRHGQRQKKRDYVGVTPQREDRITASVLFPLTSIRTRINVTKRARAYFSHQAVLPADPNIDAGIHEGGD